MREHRQRALELAHVPHHGRSALCGCAGTRALQQRALRCEPRRDEFLLHKSAARHRPDAGGVARVAHARALRQLVLLSAEHPAHHRRICELRLREVVGRDLGEPLRRKHAYDQGPRPDGEAGPGNGVSVERSRAHHGEGIWRGGVWIEAAGSWLGEGRFAASERCSSASFAMPASYIELQRAWKPGDVVEMDLPMPVRLMEANPLVEETLNQIAVQRGPIVYCLESADLPAGTRISDVLIPAGIDLVARYDRRLLGGVVILEGMAQARPAAKWNDELYREVQHATTAPLKIVLVPYSVWANRGGGEMSVWLPRAAATAPR